MDDELRPDNGPYADELAACELLIHEIEEAEKEFRAACPIAARMHLYVMLTKASALMRGEAV